VAYLLKTRFVKPAKGRCDVTTGKQAMSSLQLLLRASRVKQHVTRCFLRGLFQSIWTVRWEEKEKKERKKTRKIQ
jgi:hypothetical protein